MGGNGGWSEGWEGMVGGVRGDGGCRKGGWVGKRMVVEKGMGGVWLGTCNN